jgi:hypothetical protein
MSEGAAAVIKRHTHHTGSVCYRLESVHATLSSYANHIVTGMSGVRGSMQLTLHLQSPAAAAAAQQAAEAAAAAVEADPSVWTEHQVCGLKYAPESPC